MKLESAITEAIREFGIDIITESRFVNILMDYGAFREIPALKYIIKILIEQRYMVILINQMHRKLTDEYNIYRTCCDVTSKYGFREDLTENVIRAIVCGIKANQLKNITIEEFLYKPTALFYDFDGYFWGFDLTKELDKLGWKYSDIDDVITIYNPPLVMYGSRLETFTIFYRQYYKIPDVSYQIKFKVEKDKSQPIFDELTSIYNQLGLFLEVIKENRTFPTISGRCREASIKHYIRKTDFGQYGLIEIGILSCRYKYLSVPDTHLFFIDEENWYSDFLFS